jgi:hypothetical protein
MERSLLWTAFGVSVSGYLYSLFLAHRRRDAAPPGHQISPRLKWSAVALFQFVCIAIALFSLHYYKSGTGLGGFILGAMGASAALSHVLLAEPKSDSPDAVAGRSTALMAGPCAIAVALMAACQLVLHQRAPDAFMGIGLGWCIITAIFVNARSGMLGAPPAPILPAETELRVNEILGVSINRFTMALGSAAGFTVTVAAACVISGYRANVAVAGSPVPVAWVAPMLLLAATVPFVLLLTVPVAPLSAEAVGRVPLQRWMTAFYRRPVDTDEAIRTAIGGGRFKIAVLLFAAFTYLLAHKVTGEPHLWQAIGIGGAAAAIAWWILAADSGSDTARALRGLPQTSYSGVVAFVVMACAVMASYTLLAGVGCAVTMIAAWLIGSLAVIGALDRQEPASDGSRQDLHAVTSTAYRMLGVLIFGVVLVLYRLFEIRFAHDLDWQSADLYTLFGIIVGAALPRVASAWALGQGLSAPKRLMALVLGVLMLLLVPAAIYVLWEVQCLGGLFEGMALSIMAAELGSEYRSMSVVRAVPDASAAGASAPPVMERVLLLPGYSTAVSGLPALFALLSGLAICQWTHVLDPLTSLHRLQRAHILEGLVAAILVLALVAETMLRRRETVAEAAGGRP